MGIRISVLQVYLSHSVLFADPSRSIGCLSVRSVGDGLIRAESVFKWSACWCWIRADIPSTYTETEQALSLVFPRLPQNVSTLNKHPGKGILLIMIRERCVLSIKYENASKHSLIIHAVAGGAACLRKEHMCNELDEFFHFVETMTKRLWRRRRGWWWWRWKMQNAERPANHQVDGGENREYGGCCCCKERTSFAADLWFIILLSLYICAISPRLISTDAGCCSLCDVWFASPPSNIISQTRPTVFAIANINSGSVAYHRSVLHRVSPLPICRATSTDTNTTSHLMRGGVRGEYDIVEYIKSELLLSSPQEVLISHSPLHLHSTALHIPIPLNSHMYAGSMCRTLIIRGEREKKT